ncbi:metalloregulator ArsR/SmtB family transcription factor [Ureibacillus chungkukjangi]|uniref:ArsR/SmtB family transcription factor n=1 Tax=Ureibacillus chungkukjangi TaxID=1202712 RepID=UPI00203A4EAC|nr:metalloregulator ArsR/SmtB family transcription factor [Ureibacillus chungkukjangi]MCM3388771.1 metalloregulator ArsR/SmtB family transcription factor [Ureibacillus chungkukjangi]
MGSELQKVDIFQAIADPTRREVIRLLSVKNQSIAELSSHFEVSRNAVVKHLNVLTEAGLVRGEKSGREKIYQLQPEPLKELQEWLSYYEKFWYNKLTKLKYVVENDTLNK